MAPSTKAVGREVLPEAPQRAGGRQKRRCAGRKTQKKQKEGSDNGTVQDATIHRPSSRAGLDNGTVQDATIHRPSSKASAKESTNCKNINACTARKRQEKERQRCARTRRHVGPTVTCYRRQGTKSRNISQMSSRARSFGALVAE